VKKLIVLVLLIFGGYKLHQGGALNGLPFMSPAGAFDAQGKAMVRVFVGPNCERPCADVESLLHQRHVDYQLVDISTPEGEKYHVHQFPLTQVGKDSVLGDNFHEIVGMLASNLGPDVLTRTERMAMKNHFDENGRPIAMMYGVSWCGYCQQ
jgi:hypothetical protein